MLDKIQTGLRVPEPLYEWIQERATQSGMSVNSQILMLIDIGRTLVENGFIQPAKQEERR